MASVVIRKYNATDYQAWNAFVAESSNGTFLFHRNYMDYHADRFKDHSLLIYSDERLRAILPANEKGNIIQSHGGLTYGGFILSDNVEMEELLSFFFHALKYYSSSFGELVYKCIPSPFATLPSGDDLYALFLLKAQLITRGAGSFFERGKSITDQRKRVKNINYASDRSWTVKKASDPTLFWNEVLIPNLRDRHGSAPVHSLDEIKLLMTRFPENIHLYELHTGNLDSGALVYIMPHFAHTQYLSSTPEGKKYGAQYLLVDHLLNNTFANKQWFSLGTSNNPDGSLNRGLLRWKEDFGTKSLPYDIYQVKTVNYMLLSDYA